MKKIIAIVALAAGMLSSAIQAQTNAPLPSTSIKGTMDIVFNTQTTPTPQKGQKDIYTLDVNFCNLDVFHGTVTDLPLIMSASWGGLGSATVAQPRSLTFALDCDLINPRNPAQTKNVGSLHGFVPIGQNGDYNFDAGTLTLTTIPARSGLGVDRKFTGVAQGKPLVRPANWYDTMERQVINITRNINGRNMTVSLKKYDKMNFSNYVMAAGPVQAYGDATVSGEMLYDYEKKTWFFNGITIQYPVGNAIKIDRLTGDIRWMPDQHRAANGLGEYDFDIRVNEPLPDENAVFAAPTPGQDAEDAFFQTDNTIPALSGTMKYKDQQKNGTVDLVNDPLGNNSTTLSSAVAIDLVGNNLTKQQTMVLLKMIIFTAIVPMNAD